MNADVLVVPAETMTGSIAVVSGDQLTNTSLAGDTVHPMESTPDELINGVPAMAKAGVVNWMRFRVPTIVPPAFSTFNCT